MLWWVWRGNGGHNFLWVSVGELVDTEKDELCWSTLEAFLFLCRNTKTLTVPVWWCPALISAASRLFWEVRYGTARAQAKPCDIGSHVLFLSQGHLYSPHSWSAVVMCGTRKTGIFWESEANNKKLQKGKFRIKKTKNWKNVKNLQM